MRQWWIQGKVSLALSMIKRQIVRLHHYLQFINLCFPFEDDHNGQEDKGRWRKHHKKEEGEGEGAFVKIAPFK